MRPSLNSLVRMDRHRFSLVAVFVLASCAGIAAAAAAVAPAPPSRPAPPARGEAAPPVEATPEAEAAAPIRLDPPTWDFGYVAPKSVNKAEFKIWNMSAAEIEIAAVAASCKCTTLVDIAGKKIPPGGFVTLEAQLDAAASVGVKGASVKVLIDGFPRVSEVFMRSEVTLPIRVVPGYINAMAGKAQKGKLVVESIDKKPFRICSAHGHPPQIDGFDPETDQLRARYILHYDLEAFGADELPRYWIIETDREDCPAADVLVRHDTLRLKRGIRGVSDMKLSAGRIDPGGESLIEVEFTGQKTPLVFTSAELTSTMATAEISEQEMVEDVARVTVRITAKEGATGLLYAPLLLKTELATQRQEIIVFGRIQPKDAGCVTPAVPPPPPQPAPPQS